MELGIIPARAGFTWNIIVIKVLFQDHPRSRGVYFRIRPRKRSRRGSSPLARGLHRFPPEQVRIDGDHPRSRGVYAPRCRWLWRRRGSSPLARGLPP